MKRISITLMLLAPVIPGNAQQVTEAVSMFAFDLYAKTAAGNSSNFVFSPLSITPAFGMVALGARGETQKQLDEVFHFQPTTNFHSELGKLQQKVLKSAGDSVEICMANRAWLEKSYRVLGKYSKALRRSYSAKIATADFVGNFEASRLLINKTVEADTRSYIKNLLPEGSLDEMTRLVLTNAIYFKGKWEVPFDPKRTSARNFNLSSGETVKCPTMLADDKFGYYVGTNYQALELNYRGNKLSLLILLPNEDTPMADFERNLSLQLYQQATKGLNPEKVTVLLPKFTIETSLSLKQTLSDMGMPIAFSNAANFSGISGKDDLKISDAFHKAYIEVSEEGTTAAAATAVVVAVKSMLPANTFVANRPFIYILRHKDSGAILFMGKVENPLR
ncbi:MAG TPA: serpin family protein [Tenuifilaceae bacterium]|nr:serpin family protein [Tenuifilaceae bacterium]